MRLCPKMLLTTALLLAASSAIAQKPERSLDPELMARLSYDNSAPVRQGDVRHICIAVFRGGEYRIVRGWDNGRTQRLHGKMAKEESGQLFKLLESAEFRDLSGTHEGLIRQEAERFAAEIPLGDGSRADGNTDGTNDGIKDRLEHEAWRLQWLNGDGENPFPASVAKVVDWLQRFQPTDGKSFDSAEYPDVCPSGGLRFLQPSLAEN